MKVAVIGSGLAGLSSAWLLSQPHHFEDGQCPEVHLFEKSNTIGMDAASVNILDGKARVDVPMRGFFPGYYPTLVRFYTLLGIRFSKRNHTVIFCRMNEDTLETKPLFSYSNVLRGILGFGVPIPDFHGNDPRMILRLTYDWLRFFYRSHDHVRLTKEGKAKGKGIKLGLVNPETTIHEYLTQNNYCDAFIYDSLYAMLTGICTCPYEDCKAYPASVIMDFYGSGVLFEGTSAVSGGVQQVCKTMSKSIPHIHLQKSVVSIESFEEKGKLKVKVVDSHGHASVFDRVVIASQGNQALAMLKNPTPNEVASLGSFKYVKAPTYVHKDKRVMPTDRKYWRGLTVVASSSMDAAMSTMYMNDIMKGELASETDIFQTVSPSLDLQPESVISVSNFERAVVTSKSLEGLKLLNKIQGERGIYFVGSYAYEGIPLLEGCVCSSLNVAEKFGVKRQLVFGETPVLPSYRQTFWARFFIFWGLLLSWFLDFFL